MTDPYSDAERLLLEHPPVPLTAQQRAEHTAMLRALVTQHETGAAPGRRTRRARRHTLITILAGALVVASGGAVTGFVLRDAPDETRLVRCFSRAAPPFATGTAGTFDASVVTPDGDARESAARAIELCGYAWADGQLPWPDGGDGPGTPSAQPQPIPELHACVLPDGIVGVFPGGENTCAHLGLPESTS